MKLKRSGKAESVIGGFTYYGLSARVEIRVPSETQADKSC